jgi:ribose/xylose/arabinose/galactoside ABC-type transport system permease subunit
MRLGKFNPLSDHLLAGLTFVLIIGASIGVPGFATWWNCQTLMLYGLPLLLAAVGLTLVLIGGGIDLSVTAVMGLASVVGAQLMTLGDGGWEWALLGLVGMLLVGVGVGALNGFSVAVCGIPPFMATLTVLMLGSGCAVWFTRSEKIGGLPDAFLVLGEGLMATLFAVLIVLLLAHGLLHRSLWGRWLFLIGLNRKAAEISGVPVRAVVFTSYVVSGLFAVMGAVLLTASLETGDPVIARNSLLDVVGAAVLGGASLQGGRGSVGGTVCGVVFLVVLGNCLNLLNVHYYFVTLMKGAVILVAAVIDSRKVR